MRRLLLCSTFFQGMRYGHKDKVCLCSPGWSPSQSPGPRDSDKRHHARPLLSTIGAQKKNVPKFLKLMVVVRVCNSSIWKTKAEDSKLKARLGYIEKLSQNPKTTYVGPVAVFQL